VIRLPVIGGLVLSGAILVAAAAPCASAAPAEAPALEPGASGVVLTAIRGDDVQEIPLVYVGILHDFAGPGYDVHLVELEGPLAEEIGVANGMSGSPVYIDGRLIGALAYRFGAMPKKAIAGVTPIDDILDAQRAQGARPPQGSAVTAISAPIHVGGLAPVVWDWLAPQLEEMGFVLTAGGSGGSTATVPATIRPGSPVGVAMLRGDMTMAATGTATWVDGETVYAFGHPFFGRGRTEMPLMSATVVHTLADTLGSVKLANVGDEVGAIVEDRLTTVVGRIGAKARMIPLRLRVNGADYGSQEFNFEVVRNIDLAPLLVGTAVANALVSNTGYDDEATMFATGTIRLRDLPDLPLEMAFAADNTAGHSLAVAMQLMRLLGALWFSPIGEVDVESIDLDVAVEPRRVSYQLESLVYDRGPVRPGQRLEIGCVLRRHRGESVTRTLSLTVPHDLARNAQLRLAVGSPDQLELALNRPLRQRQLTATGLESLVGTLAERRSAHRLGAVLYERSRGAIAQGEAYAGLPPTAQHLMGTLAATSNRRRTDVTPLVRAEIELDGPLSGGLRIRLQLNPDLSSEDANP